MALRFLFLLIAASVALTFLILNTSEDAGEGALDAVLEAEGATGAILVRRLSDGAEWTGGGSRVDERFVAASTFKIANSLIILEAGVVSGPDADPLAWDGVDRLPGWDQDQTLRTAFARSAVWAYQHWARQVGHARMTEAVARLEYANADIGAPERLVRFWLEGPLEISAREQVDFLQRLHARWLPVAPEIQNQVVDLMRHRAGEGWLIRAKTGWAIRDEPNHGWYVGWLEAAEDVWIFAVNVDLDWETGEGALRERLARNALIAVGAPVPPVQG
ncbi:MAG: penicillin-binding transpeptidase domain-containing protein [Pseudomonadota bacterium]